MTARPVAAVALAAIALTVTAGPAAAAPRHRPPSAATIRHDITTRQPGCWSVDGSNFAGAYASYSYFPGATPIAPSGDPGTGACTGGTSGFAVANVAVYRSPGQAKAGALEMSAGHDIALYQAGDVAVSVYPQATPAEARTISRVPGLASIR